MGRRLNIVFLATIGLAAMLHSSLAQTTYVVGNATGWVRPSGPAFYTTWAANNTFRVGDTLVFNFVNGNHDVGRVTRANFDSCNAANPLVLLLNSPANVTLNQTGDHYFLCTFSDHCSAGQKLAINVSAAASSPAPQPSTPAPQPVTPPPASTPRPSASAPAPPPQAGPPSPISAPPPASTLSPMTPPPPPSSSSPPPSTGTPPPPSSSPPATPPSSSNAPPSPTEDNTSPPPMPGNSATYLGVAGLSTTFLSFIVAFFM